MRLNCIPLQKLNNLVCYKPTWLFLYFCLNAVSSFSQKYFEFEKFTDLGVSNFYGDERGPLVYSSKEVIYYINFECKDIKSFMFYHHSSLTFYKYNIKTEKNDSLMVSFKNIPNVQEVLRYNMSSFAVSWDENNVLISCFKHVLIFRKLRNKFTYSNLLY